MRASIPPIMVISFFVAGALMGGSGFADFVGVDRSPGLQSEASNLNDSVREYSANRPGGLSVFTGFILAVVDMFMTGITWALMFPIALMNMGFPTWFAIPLGTPIQFVMYIGVAQILRGMNIR